MHKTCYVPCAIDLNTVITSSLLLETAAAYLHTPVLSLSWSFPLAALCPICHINVRKSRQWWCDNNECFPFFDDGELSNDPRHRAARNPFFCSWVNFRRPSEERGSGEIELGWAVAQRKREGRICSPYVIGCSGWNFISNAISVVSDSIAIDSAFAYHISTARFVRDATMNPLVCFLYVSRRGYCLESLACKIEFALGANVTLAGRLVYDRFKIFHNLTEIETWVLSRYGLCLLFLGSVPIYVGALGPTQQENVFLWVKGLCVSISWVSECHQMCVQKFVLCV